MLFDFIEGESDGNTKRLLRSNSKAHSYRADHANEVQSDILLSVNNPHPLFH